MNDLVPKDVAAEFVGWVSLDEETSGGMDPARPGLELTKNLKLLPVFRLFEDVDVRFDAAGRVFPFQFLRNDTVVKFGFDRNWGRDATVNKMVNEMIGLTVFPLLGMNRERFFAERVWVALACLREFNLGERSAVVDLGDGRGRAKDRPAYGVAGNR